uniref:Uncharacterized protein n=1 Tax=Anguilla anguilla TaxID=7936 RepID=A0A0E9WIB7_ANGAN
MKLIASATSVQEKIDRGEINMMGYLFDVILQEVIIRILKRMRASAAIGQNLPWPADFTIKG